MVQFKVFDISLAIGALAAVFLVLPADRDTPSHRNTHQPKTSERPPHSDSLVDSHKQSASPSYQA